MHSLEGHLEKLQTPYFSFDLARVNANYHEFLTLLPGVKVFYAMKSNSAPEILQSLHEEGSGFEIASTGELDKLLKIGVSPDKIIYSNPVKSKQSIDSAYRQGIRKFSFDSSQELRKLAEYAPGSEVFLRIAVSEYGSRFSMSEKFGVLPAEALGLVKEAVELELKFVGIAFHVGSQAENLAQWRTAIEEVKEVIVELMENDIRLEFLNIGGGYPESYRTAETPSLQDIAAEVRSVVAELPYELDLYVEPGRRLVANAATLTVSVIARLERNEENWLFLDAGAYSGVFEAMVFQGNMRFDIDSPPDRTGKTTLFVLTGPTCDSLDTISYNAELPDDIQEGDKLVIKNVGAYSLCFATEFNGFEIPKAYFD